MSRTPWIVLLWLVCACATEPASRDALAQRNHGMLKATLENGLEVILVDLPDVGARYQRAADVLQDLLHAAERPVVRRTSERPAAVPPGEPVVPPWPRPRETPQPRFCWHCRKPLHARSDRCPFCGEAQ